MFSTRRRLATGAALALLAVPALAACQGADNEELNSGRGGDEQQPTISATASPEGGSAPGPVASIDSLTGNSTQIALDQGFVSALGKLKLTPGVVGTAKLADGTLTFPITGGNVTYFKPGTVSPYVVGQIQHEGSGLTLTGGGKTVQLTNLDVDPGVSRVYGDVTVDGTVAATSAYLFTLDGRTLQPLKSGNGTATLQGTKVEISPVAAKLLNQTFGTTAVTSGLLVGTATITVSTTSGE